MFRECSQSGLASLGLWPNFQGFETREGDHLVGVLEISFPLGREGTMGTGHWGAAVAPVSNGEAMKPAAWWRKCYWILGREAHSEAGTSSELEGGAPRGGEHRGHMSAGQRVRSVILHSQNWHSL